MDISQKFHRTGTLSADLLNTLLIAIIFKFKYFLKALRKGVPLLNVALSFSPYIALFFSFRTGLYMTNYRRILPEKNISLISKTTLYLLLTIITLTAR